MKRRIFFTFLLALAATLRGEPPHAAALAEASQAIEEKVPQVAIAKLKALLAENLAPDERALVTRRLARALIDAGSAEEAVKILGDATAEERLLKAEALAAMGRWADAAEIFWALAASPGADSTPATLGLAESLWALGKPRDALRELETLIEKTAEPRIRLRFAELLLETKATRRAESALSQTKPLTDFEKKWKTSLEGRALLARDQAAPALQKFEEVLRDPRFLTESLFASATIGSTEAHIILNGLGVADNVLENFIWHHPESALLDEMCARLDQIYAEEENASETELQKWSQKPPRRRAALALFYLAKMQIREQKTEKALRSLGAFLRDYPAHPLAAKAAQLQGEILLPDKPAAAISAFENAMRHCGDAGQLAAMEIAAGAAHFRQREFLLAANLFQTAAERAPKLWAQATYDAALAWLHLGNYDKFLDQYKTLSQRVPESGFRRDLLLEEGLLQARSGDPRATASLQLFLRDFPDHQRVPEARVALAEIAFMTSDIDGASQWLRVANESPAGRGSERGDYLAIFVADAVPERSDEKVLALCEEFLRQHRDSALVPEVRMKLGQVYFRREDFANAQTQFETLASEASTGPLAETALFLAGQSAMRSMNSGGIDRALELFERVTKLNGALKLYARQEQAIAKTQLGKQSEAVLLYDAILRSNPPPELRFAALCGRADNLIAATNAPANAGAQAVALYDQLAADPDVTPFWKHQALYKKAKLLEKTGDRPTALTAFYDVLQPTTGGEPEFFWFFKAGFDAARLLEADEKWEAAIGIYEKMAKSAGPRAEEAKNRANQLRLEHFIWDAQ